jgi:oligopeptide/dipeptide ABC transporter ATP-binding protein
MHSDILVKTVNLKKYYEVRSKFLKRVIGYVKAVDGVDLEIKRGETLGLVGESGSGKSTLGLVLAKLIKPSDGNYFFNSVDVTYGFPKNFRGKIRIVFQDPYSALNPRLKIVDSVIEPLIVQGIDKKKAREKAIEYLKLVGLNEDYLENYPHMLSGGQKQRVVIARALITEPEFLILDEPTSMLDVSTQAQIIELLKKIKNEKNLTYLFITHNLAVARYLSDTIAIMFSGQIVEIADKKTIFSNPLHPYTKTLLSAYPSPDPSSTWSPEIPEDINNNTLTYNQGCRYASRCPLRKDLCLKTSPELIEVENNHKVRCHIYKDTT